MLGASTVHWSRKFHVLITVWKEILGNIPSASGLNHIRQWKKNRKKSLKKRWWLGSWLGMDSEVDVHTGTYCHLLLILPGSLYNPKIGYHRIGYVVIYYLTTYNVSSGTLSLYSLTTWLMVTVYVAYDKDTLITCAPALMWAGIVLAAEAHLGMFSMFGHTGPPQKEQKNCPLSI